MNKLSELKIERKHILDDYSQALMIFKEINKLKVESQEQAGETAEKQMNLSNCSDKLDSFQASFLGLNLSSKEAFYKLKEIYESIKKTQNKIIELEKLKEERLVPDDNDLQFFIISIAIIILLIIIFSFIW